MASRSDSGNETRGSSESDNSPTPTKEIQSRGRFTPTNQRGSRTSNVTPTCPSSHSNTTVGSHRTHINTRTTPVSRTTPTTCPYPQQQTSSKLTPMTLRLTPTAQSRGPLRPLQRRPPSSGMGSSGSVHSGPPLNTLGSLLSNRGRQRNSVAVVDSRDHIYEELDVCRAPPKLAPVSGVLPQGKVVIRPIAFKPVVPQGGNPGASSGGDRPLQGGPKASVPNGGHANSSFAPLEGSRPDPRYTSTPTLSRGPIHHYGSMGDLKTLSQNTSYSLDRRGLGPPISNRNYYDPYIENNNNSNDKNKANTKYSNSNYRKGVQPPACLMYNDSHNSPQRPRRTPPLPNPGSVKGVNMGVSPPSYPLPPPRPPSHQSTCSTHEEGHLSRYSLDSRLSSNYDGTIHTPSTPSTGFSSRSTSGYESSPTTGTSVGNIGSPASDFGRYESFRTLSSTPSSAEQRGGSVNHPRLHAHQRMGGSVSNLTRLVHAGPNLGLDRSLSVTGSNLGLERSVGSIRGSLNELRLDSRRHPLHQTPSPSDSGVAELEAMLKEKDSEINNLKETMEQNEQVIFKVYEEKEKTWERELKKIRDLYESRLKTAQQKALKVEQSLSTQTYQLQQERRKVSSELEEMKRERDGGNKQVEQLKKEVSSLRSQLEETEWSLCQKSGEISLLKTQLKDSQGDQTTRGHELLHLRAQVRQYQQEVERRRAEISSLHDLTTQLRRETVDLRSQLDHSRQNNSQDQELSNILDKTRSELDSMQRDKESQRATFEEEKLRWVEEKERVIRYQKQLHHNYVSMLSRNRQLEEEVARLTGVPLPPMSSSASIGIPPSLPPLSSCLPSGGSNYSEMRDSSITVNGESRC